MANKYHITKKGEPGVCRATKGACPLGGEGEHFPTKEAARDHLEEKMKKAQYGFATSSKASQEAFDDFEALPRDVYYHEAGPYLSDNLSSEYEVGPTIEGPDYLNQTLVTRGRNTYVIGTHGGPYTNFNVVRYSRVLKVEKPVVIVSAKEVKNTKDLEAVKATFKELAALPSETIEERYKWEKHPLLTDRKGDRYIDMDFLAFEKTFEREDGTFIYMAKIKPEGDRDFTDEPLAVQAPTVEFTENGEKQNSRRMETGYIIYDSRSGEGVLMKRWTVSDGYSDASTFSYSEDGTIKPDLSPDQKESRRERKKRYDNREMASWEREAHLMDLDTNLPQLYHIKKTGEGLEPYYKTTSARWGEGG